MPFVNRLLLLWIIVSFSSAISLRVLAVLFISEESYRLILIFIPLILTALVSFIDIKKYHERLDLIKYALISSIIIYIISLSLLDDQNFKDFFVWTVITLFIFYSIYVHRFNNMEKTEKGGTKELSKRQKPLFIIYYLNFSKTYDFITLINNKFKVNINNERNEEIAGITNVELGLSNIQTGANARINRSSSTSKSERILENFEIKNTKSTHLQQILIHAKEVHETLELTEGSLIKFSNIQLELQDQKENIEAIKLLLGGAFKGFNIKGQEEGMDFELNLSSLIESFLAECEYKLTFEYCNKSYYITIPLTGNDDFENDYTVNDLLTGRISIIGIYKGNYERHAPFVNTLFSLNENNNDTGTSMPTPVGELTQSEYGNDETTNPDNTLSKGKITESVNNGIYIDVIAVIQEVNFKKEDKFSDD